MLDWHLLDTGHDLFFPKKDEKNAPRLAKKDTVLFIQKYFVISVLKRPSTAHAKTVRIKLPTI